MAKQVRTLTTAELCQEVAEVLMNFDGKMIKDTANQVLSNPVKYQGDSIFTQELPE